jgi:DNA primase
MKVTEDQIERAKQADLPSHCVKDGILLKSSADGTRMKGRCPFHNEKSPSFTMRLVNGRWVFKCFGCGQGGDAITYAMKNYSLTFPEAVAFLDPVHQSPPLSFPDH